MFAVTSNSAFAIDLVLCPSHAYRRVKDDQKGLRIGREQLRKEKKGCDFGRVVPVKLADIASGCWRARTNSRPTAKNHNNNTLDHSTLPLERSAFCQSATRYVSS